MPPQMKQVVMDTSSMVSLELIGALKPSLAITKVFVPFAVRKELEEISIYADKEGKAAKNCLYMIENKSIEVCRIKDEKKVGKLLSSNVNRGEAECFVCCLENEIKMLIMDDVDAAYALEGLAISHDIKIRISVSVLMQLHKQKLIEKKKLQNYIKDLIKIREWEGGVPEVLADKYLDDS